MALPLIAGAAARFAGGEMARKTALQEALALKRRDALAETAAGLQPLPETAVRPRPSEEPEPIEDEEARLAGEGAQTEAAELLRAQQQQAWIARQRQQSVTATQSAAKQQVREAAKKKAVKLVKKRIIIMVVGTCVSGFIAALPFLLFALLLLIMFVLPISDLLQMGLEMGLGFIVDIVRSITGI